MNIAHKPHSHVLQRHALSNPVVRRTQHFRSLIPKPCPCGRIQLDYSAEADPVVSTDWLAQHLEEVTVLDVRGHVDTEVIAPGEEKSAYVADYNAYLEGHIPGAIFWDWTKDAVDVSAAVPVQLQEDPDLLAAALEAKGVSSSKPVVAYDAGDGMMAARLWWMLTVAGHANAFVLEGGWTKWLHEKRPVDLFEPCTLKVYGCFEADMQPQLRASLEDIERILEPHASHTSSSQPLQQDCCTAALLLDTRNPQQYSGTVKRGPRGGHIPGSVNLPRAALLNDATQMWLPLEDQRQQLLQAGVALPDPSNGAADDSSTQSVVVYCNGGVAACTAALALHRLGHRNWSVYDGSWNEYSISQLPVQHREQ